MPPKKRTGKKKKKNKKSKLPSSHSDSRSSFTSSNGLNQSQMMNVTVHLAEDLIAQILDRLPVKDLLRFRCVSKPWCSLIDSPRFVRAHLKRSTECKTNTGVIIRSFHAYLADFDSLDDTTAVKIEEPLRTLLQGTGVVGSCNGLLCLYQKKTDIFLWNPATRKCRVLPTAPSDFVRPYDIDPTFIRGFGYDAVNDDYKVLRILYPYGRDLAGSKVIVYSLKTNSWRRLQSISNQFQLFSNCGMFVGGALHWIAIKTLGLESCLLILAFDLAVEKHKEVPMPNVGNKNYNQCSLFIFAESLCVVIHEPFISIDVWLMNEYGVGNSWCKQFSLEHPQLVRSRYVRPVAYSKSCRDVLVEVGDEKMMWYNLERKNVRAVKIANIPYVFHDLEVYTESLVPPYYISVVKGSSHERKRNSRNNRGMKGTDFFPKDLS